MSDNDFLTRGCSCNPKPFNNNNNSIYSHGCCKLDSHNWLEDIELPKNSKIFDCIEVRFKNSRKEYFKTPIDTHFEVGDFVAVEALPGHDIGIVSMVGESVRLQMKKRNINPESEDIKKVYRKAKSSDIEKWISAIEKEKPTMYKSRKLAADLSLEMKISDIEYQGDKTKAIFYYTADERVDFRELIKVLAEEFSVRIEMKQIGVRQEASRLGGIGSCGRELCCSTWLTDFRSVSTSSARNQQLSLNPQKLAGQCSKLKCCLNYENDCYVDALKEFPDNNLVLKTKKGDASHQKTDVFRKLLWYSYASAPYAIFPVTLENVNKVIEDNKKNTIPNELIPFEEEQKEKQIDYENVVGQDSLTRFDKK